MNTDRAASPLVSTQARTRRRLLAISLDIVTERASAARITVHAWQLPVTEGLYSRHEKGGSHGQHPEIRSTRVARRADIGVDFPGSDDRRRDPHPLGKLT